jgi:hypothetical protein
MKKEVRCKIVSEILQVELIKPAVSELMPCKDELTESSEEMEFSVQSLERLKAIQHVICLEEGRSISLSEVLDRILTFYRRFVPFD